MTFLQRARQTLAAAFGGKKMQADQLAETKKSVGKALQLRRFAAARIDRLTSDWMATESSLNHELRSDLNKLRSRGRDLLQNNDYAVKFAGMCADNIIGPGGVRLQVRIEDSPGKPDRIANAAIESAWKDWSSACDVTGRQSLRDLCSTLVHGLPSDGEFLVRFVLGTDARNKYGIALQVIDVDRIDTTMNFGPTATTNAVIMGVEVDNYRRPVALHLFAAHPSDGVHSSRQRIRLPIDETLHCFKIERAEQMRGIPWMSAGMLSLHHLGNFKLSALLAAEHGANHYGFFTTPDGQSPIGATGADGQKITTSQPGVYDTLPTGTGFIQNESKYPNEVFGPFVKTTLQRIASGWRVAYHSLANDLEGVSYSSIRSGALEERDRWSADQEWFISVFMEPVYKKWLQMSLIMGAITMPNGSALPAAKLAKFSQHEWQARRWEWVDPKGDMEAKILAVKAGLMAPQDLANAMGYDFDDTLTSIAAAQALAKQLGVQLTAYDPTPGAQIALQAPAKNP
jgi:lambda family phage portal protein